MPELPEVQTVINTLRPGLLGRKMVRITLHRQDIVQPPDLDLSGHLRKRIIRDIDRRGKRIVFTLDNGCRFYIHLGMTGQLTITQKPSQALLPHTHLLINLDSNAQLRFRDVRRFGGIFWLGCTASPADEMGPEPLTIGPKQLAGILSRTKRAIKTALLDQKLLAGLGNIYVDEALFASGIHPVTPAKDLTKVQIARLCRSIKTTLRRAIRHNGSSLRDYVDANGSSGRYQDRHFVYARGGKPCRRCSLSVERLVLGGRSTHFCPSCQPLLASRIPSC